MLSYSGSTWDPFLHASKYAKFKLAFVRATENKLYLSPLAGFRCWYVAYILDQFIFCGWMCPTSTFLLVKYYWLDKQVLLLLRSIYLHKFSLTQNPCYCIISWTHLGLLTLNFNKGIISFSYIANDLILNKRNFPTRGVATFCF